MPKLEDLTGREFGLLTVISRYIDESRNRPLWVCRCLCGGTAICLSENLRQGASTSCGCKKVKANKERGHGFSKTPTYKIWKAMKERCYRPSAINFPDYGGRGISVCDRWKDSFQNFLADMGERPSKKHSIERKDNNGNYCKENCVWAQKIQQIRNRSNTLTLLCRGETRPIAEWAEISGVPYNIIRQRIHLLGWNAERAIFTPQRPMRNWRKERDDATPPISSAE